MGILDRLLRRKANEARSRSHTEPILLEIAQSESRTELAEHLSLYQRLKKKHRELISNREKLAMRMDRSEITGTQFRKELMECLLEAARIHDSIKKTALHLVQLGYKGILVE
jgi:hypothetical protein